MVLSYRCLSLVFAARIRSWQFANCTLYHLYRQFLGGSFGLVKLKQFSHEKELNDSPGQADMELQKSFITKIYYHEKIHCTYPVCVFIYYVLQC